MEFLWDIALIVEPAEAHGQRTVKLVFQLDPDARIFARGCGAICWGVHLKRDPVDLRLKLN